VNYDAQERVGPLTVWAAKNARPTCLRVSSQVTYLTPFSQRSRRKPLGSSGHAQPGQSNPRPRGSSRTAHENRRSARPPSPAHVRRSPQHPTQQPDDGSRGREAAV
jgi:hypothetical protein